MRTETLTVFDAEYGDRVRELIDERRQQRRARRRARRRRVTAFLMSFPASVLIRLNG